MKIIIKTIIYSLIFISQTYACDLKDPICVTRVLVENTVRFNSKGMERFYCQEEKWVNDIIGSMKNELENIQTNEINKYSDIVFDFSMVFYKIQEISEKRAVVQVSGAPKIKHEVVKFDDKNEIKGPYILHKINSDWVLCSSLEKVKNK